MGADELKQRLVDVWHGFEQSFNFQSICKMLSLMQRALHFQQNLY